MVFFAAEAVGFAWVIWWSLSYKGNNDASIATLDARLVATQLSFADVLGMRRVQVLVFAKFMSDSAGTSISSGCRSISADVRGFDVKHVSYCAWIPYAASGVGSFPGGWLSSALLKRGLSLDFSRKFVLGLSGYAFMPVVMLVPHVPVGWALVLFSIAFFLSTVVVRLDYDFACRHLSVVRGGVGIGSGSDLEAPSEARFLASSLAFLLGHGFGYETLFSIVGTFHLIGVSGHPPNAAARYTR